MNQQEKQKALNELKEIENRADALRTMINNADKKPITERVSNFADILAEAGFAHYEWNNHLDRLRTAYTVSFSNLLSVPAMARLVRYQVAKAVVELIFEVVNDGDERTFKNTNTHKWYPYFKWDARSGRFVFFNSYYYFTNSDAGLGPRLCLASDKKATFVGRTFGDEINELLCAQEEND